MDPNAALSPRLRGYLYQLVFWLGVATVVLIAVFGALEQGWPAWFKGFVAGTAAFGSALGLTARNNLNAGGTVNEVHVTVPPLELQTAEEDSQVPNLDYSDLGSSDPDPDLDKNGHGDVTGHFKSKGA